MKDEALCFVFFRMKRVLSICSEGTGRMLNGSEFTGIR